MQKYKEVRQRYENLYYAEFLIAYENLTNEDPKY
jgi:hypothetical protein